MKILLALACCLASSLAAQPPTSVVASRIGLHEATAYKVAPNGNTYVAGFDLDASNNLVTRLLIVEPTGRTSELRRFNTGSDLSIRSIAFDSQGNIVLGGLATYSLPTTPQAFQARCASSGFFATHCAFIWKLTGDGQNTIFATYLGGSDEDSGRFVEVLPDNSIVIAGDTQSDDFPVTQNAFQRTRAGGYRGLNGGGTPDIFISRLDQEGGTLIFSSYLGGNAIESLRSASVTPEYLMAVAGFTIIVDDPFNSFPTTSGAYQSRAASAVDGFFALIDLKASGLRSSTFLGGNDKDLIRSVSTMPDGVFVSGETASSDFISSGSRSGPTDGFVVKLSLDGTLMLQSTLVGGSNADSLNISHVDPSGQVFLVGRTNSADFPVVNPIQNTLNPNDPNVCANQPPRICNDFVLVALKSDFSRPFFSSFLGGSASENIFVDGASRPGNLTLVGSSDSNDFPTTVNSESTGKTYFAAIGFEIDDFRLSIDGSSVLRANDPASSISLLVQPAGSTFGNPISLSCIGLPSGYSCSFDQNPVSSIGSSTRVSLRVMRLQSAALGWWIIPLAIAGFASAKKVQKKRMASVAALALCLLVGCGGPAAEVANVIKPAAAEPVPFKIAATSGALRHEVSATLLGN